ncbi:MAG: transporter substrate-binding domain-containing protein [Faecousia sp.]
MNAFRKLSTCLKKILCGTLCLGLALGYSGCGRHQEEDRLEAIRQRGYIEVCTEPYFAPFEFIDASKSGDEQYVGMDIKLARYIADKLDVELRIVPLEFTALLTAMSEGKYDMAISALAYSPARAESMNLSKGYYFGDSDYGFLVRQGDEEKYTSVEDLKDAVVVTQSGSVQEALYKQYVPACKEFKLVSSMTDGYLMVSEGKADVCVCSTGSAQLYAEANGGLGIPDFAFEVDESMQGTRVGMPLGTDSLTEFVNECIEELRETNQLEVWYEEAEAYAKTLGVS